MSQPAQTINQGGLPPISNIQQSQGFVQPQGQQQVVQQNIQQPNQIIAPQMQQQAQFPQGYPQQPFQNQVQPQILQQQSSSSPLLPKIVMILLILLILGEAGYIAYTLLAK